MPFNHSLSLGLTNEKVFQVRKGDETIVDYSKGHSNYGIRIPNGLTLPLSDHMFDYLVLFTNLLYRATGCMKNSSVRCDF